MKKLALAISITAESFKDKLDKGGQPYILHCFWVMNNTEGDECTKCAAMMHDLIEDCPDKWSLKKLTELGFSDKTIGLLHLLTHQKETDYMEYIKSISVNKDATRIKLSDLRHNSDIMRLKGLSKKDHDRIQKYHIAYTYLSN